MEAVEDEKTEEEVEVVEETEGVELEEVKGEKPASTTEDSGWVHYF